MYQFFVLKAGKGHVVPCSHIYDLSMKERAFLWIRYMVNLGAVRDLFDKPFPQPRLCLKASENHTMAE